MADRKTPGRFRGREPGDHSDMIALCLRDGSVTGPEIEEQFFCLMRHAARLIAALKRG